MTDLVEPRDIVDGESRSPAARLDEWLTDPNTGTRLQCQVASAPEDVERAIAGASWSGSDDESRVALLERIADAVEAVTSEIAVMDSLTSGVPANVTALMAGSIPGTFRDAARRLRQAPSVTDMSRDDRTVRLHRLPWGPAAVIAPWNAPTVVAAKKVAYALAAGCPVICKPSPWGPNGFTVLAGAMTPVVPAGVLQVVHGDGYVGSLLAGDARIRALSLTGSRATGRQVARLAADDLKALQLELGSNNPVVVLPDADVDTTAHALVAGTTKLNGQWCEGPGSVFVPGELHDALVDALLDRFAAVRLGHSLEPDTDMGPQANVAQHERLRGELTRLEAHGGRSLSSTKPPELPGWFLAPTVVRDVDPAEARDELFGPILTVHAVADTETAVALANRCALGLAGYVFGGDEDAALGVAARIGSGEVKVNGTSILDLVDESTQGFWGASGIGGHGDAALLEFFRGARITGVDPADMPL